MKKLHFQCVSVVACMHVYVNDCELLFSNLIVSLKVSKLKKKAAFVFLPCMDVSATVYVCVKEFQFFMCVCCLVTNKYYEQQLQIRIIKKNITTIAATT